MDSHIFFVCKYFSFKKTVDFFLFVFFFLYLCHESLLLVREILFITDKVQEQYIKEGLR